MDKPMQFDYYYGIEAEQFSFYRVPRLLIKDERFKGLSSDAKLLYGLMLDRMALSMKNGWFDAENRAYIIYTVDNIMEDLGCAKATCVKVMKELDSDNGIGLIEKKRRGLGKPDIIYVKNFAAITEDEPEPDRKEQGEPAEVQNLNFRKSEICTSGSIENERQEVQNLNLRRFTAYTSRSTETEPAEVQKADSNYTNHNYTDIKQTEDNHINPIRPQLRITASGPKCPDGIDVTVQNAETADYIKLIKKNIEYEHHMRYDNTADKEIYRELFDIICEVVCIRRDTVRINGEDYPYSVVKSRFLKLDDSHLEYVIGCMRETKTKINNIHAYLLTALFNAPSTMKHYFQQEVNHDMFGGGWDEKGIV